METTYEEKVAASEALIEKACVFSMAADRARDPFIQKLYHHNCDVLYARAVEIKKAAREMVVRAGKEGAN